MAKLKGGKSKAAATAVSNVEGASGNDKTIVDPAPSSKPVALENTAVQGDDKPEEVVDNNNEEETENGDLDEPEEIDEEEPKEVVDVNLEEEVDKVEEAKDGLDDKPEDGDADKANDEEGEEGDAKDEDGIVESVGTDVVPEGEVVEGEKKAEGEEKVVEEIDVKDNNAKGGATPNKKLLQKLRRKKKAAAEKKEIKLADGMGLVFMCNAKTKQDCFRYKVFGLPAGKKELVAKIYKGMRLFLFDIDLKLMYGVYKADSPGGYNIEPKAFKSAFPAQVRFRVLVDCLPLPEEKFKAAIKENYYGKNKFDTQLSQEQVKNLCKLFQKAGKIPKKKNTGEAATVAEPELPPPARGRRNTRKGVREPERISSARGRKRTVEPERTSTRGLKRSRHEGERVRHDNHRYARREEAHPFHARRGASPPPPSYEYYYRRDHLPPPQLLVPREYRRDPPQQVDPRDYRIPYNEYMAPPASYPAAYAPPPSGAYAPSSGNLGLSAYAPLPSGSLGQSAYAPSSSLYYRY